MLFLKINVMLLEKFLSPLWILLFLLAFARSESYIKNGIEVHL